VPRKSVSSTNPIRVLRLSQHKTLEAFAAECGVHLQALYLNEMGMYPTVLPSISKRITSHYEVNADELEEQYQQYVSDKRYQFGEVHKPYVLNEPSLGHDPLRDFRTSLGYNTVFGFAIAVAINPTTVRRVESCTTDNFPGQLRLALRDIQLPVGDIEELEIRHQEYYYSGLRFKRTGSSEQAS